MLLMNIQINYHIHERFALALAWQSALHRITVWTQFCIIFGYSPSIHADCWQSQKLAVFRKGVTDAVPSASIEFFTLIS